MGFDSAGIPFILNCHRNGVSFRQTITIGRQGMHLHPSEFDRFREWFTLEETLAAGGMCEAFLKKLGAVQVDSLDASDYEGATCVRDLNIPIETEPQWSCVIDGGSLEHIFNFPQALKTCMEIVQEGGHFIGISPLNNQAGHGFYQFSPEIFYRAFSEANGFEVRLMENSSGHAIPDPAGKMESANGFGGYLYVLARRNKIVPLFQRWPQQSSFTKMWNQSS